jgi:hypothetical protein
MMQQMVMKKQMARRVGRKGTRRSKLKGVVEVEVGLMRRWRRMRVMQRRLEQQQRRQKAQQKEQQGAPVMLLLVLMMVESL